MFGKSFADAMMRCRACSQASDGPEYRDRGKNVFRGLPLGSTKCASLHIVVVPERSEQAQPTEQGLLSQYGRKFPSVTDHCDFNEEN